LATQWTLDSALPSNHSDPDKVVKALLRKLDQALSDAQRLSIQVEAALKDLKQQSKPAPQIERRRKPRPK
jgi:hypothetical protein